MSKAYTSSHTSSCTLLVAPASSRPRRRVGSVCHFREGWWHQCREWTNWVHAARGA